MKINVSNEMRLRLQNAAANGSTIAADVLAELKKDCDVSEIIRGNYNYFSTKRKKTECGTFQKIRIVFTACSKNLTHGNFPDKGNPNAQWFPENRSDLEPSTFIELFKNLPEYESGEIKYFGSAISLDSKISIRIGSTMNDFLEAYDASNYTLIADTDSSTLHNSCMRYENKARNAADFYKNFAGAKIMVAKDSNNYVVGRAVIWDKLVWERSDNPDMEVSLMDRIYTSHSFVLEMMKRHAQDAGIHFRKQYNDFSHTKECIVMNPVGGTAAGDHISALLSREVPVCCWHKKGVPYMDTFLSISLTEGKLELRNHSTPNTIANCQNTDGSAQKAAQVCPRCNKIHSRYDQIFCNACTSEIYTDTAFGIALNSQAISYHGVWYPASLFKKRRPLPTFRRYLQIERLFMS